ncbi:hypothetical protein [Microcystis sp. M061S2]|uniref:hypothetical protein n=1 Tax=Microcystis sp. M061S2 TaxID=2771171 RepID=UPI00258BA3BC|nr:hypothetical protein [Microcystis sp. M061S2]MCA2654526.1 hypothetical protein [Microcystis sp. M061S2]
MKWKNKTRGGYEVRIYATDGSGDYPIHGAVHLNGLGWQLQKWTHNGQHSYDVRTSLDLIPDVPEPPEPIDDTFVFDEGIMLVSPESWERLDQFYGHKIRVRIEVVE